MGETEDLVSKQLTDGERLQVSIMLEKLTAIHSQAEQVKGAISELITSIVTSRGLDPKQYGVNIEQGKVLPLEERKS